MTVLNCEKMNIQKPKASSEKLARRQTLCIPFYWTTGTPSNSILQIVSCIFALGGNGFGLQRSRRKDDLITTHHNDLAIHHILKCIFKAMAD